MQADGVDLAGIRTSDVLTACAVAIVDANGKNSIVVGRGVNRDAKADLIPVNGFSNKDLLILQMAIPFSENWYAIEQVKGNGCKVMLSVTPAAPALMMPSQVA